MSSKFFTWTKGDKRNTIEAYRGAGGVLPIQGLENARSIKGSNKASNKPAPLPLESNPEPKSRHHSRTHDSLALHDAAIQSATNLMTLMSDVLHSPQLSAHMSAQSRSAGFMPNHGSRSRSQTAPPTPLLQNMIEPVELPGSIPIDRRSDLAFRPYTDQKTDEILTQYPKSATTETIIPRPHSSPQETSAPLPRRPHTSTDFFRHPEIFPAVPPSTRTAGRDRYRRIGMVLSDESAEDTSVAHEMGNSTTPSTLTNRSVVSTLFGPLGKSGPSSESAPTSRTGSALSIPRLSGNRDGNAMYQHEQLQEADAEVTLIGQISDLRASHEAHLNSLREAHEKEVASHRSYINFLETRRGLPATNASSDSTQTLRIDTSHDSQDVSTNTSATTLQSFESSLDSQKQSSSEAPTEVEILKRKLSLWRKAQVDAVEIRRERDHLREATERSDKRLVQLKDIVRKAKDNEKSLKNALADLEARLVAANNERTDVLEGYHTACEQVRTLSLREKIICQELEDAQIRLFYCSAQSTAEEQHVQAHSESGTTFESMHDMNVVTGISQQINSLLKQVEDLRRLATQKDARIHELEHGSSREPESDNSQLETQSDKISAMELELDIQKQMLSSAQGDAERYHSLLQEELRRQSRSAATKPLPVTPSVEAEAFTIATEKTNRMKSQTVSTPSTDGVGAPQDRLIETLEKELQHCIREIILYKLDVKGYRKDIKKANAKIENLRAAGRQDPPMADRESLMSVKGNTSPELQRRPRSDSAHQPAYVSESLQSGLGISLSEPFKTPTKSMSEATSRALLSPTPPPSSSTLSSPPTMPRTPLSAHKKLPKPPPSPRLYPVAAGQPSTESKVQRTETHRSLSESIISSYAKCSTHEQNSDGSPHARERSSDPPRGRTSPLPPPLSKFASSQPQTQGPTTTNVTRESNEGI